jgi:CubicO group peptidase (beta-lactamase class C family)
MLRHVSQQSDRAISRREFSIAAMAGLACWPSAGRTFSQVTGSANPKLTGYDELMNGFMRDHKPPGASLAVAYRGRLVYARGFGHADVEKKEAVQPNSLFRIASISKTFTSAAVLHLIEKGHLKLDDKVFKILNIEPHLEPGAKIDPRLHDVEVQHCLHHTAGWDRDKSFDPMSAETAEVIAKSLKVPLPINPRQIVRYTFGKPLDTTPGTTYAYSNFGFSVLGRVIQAISKKSYEEYVVNQILAPAGIHTMRQGRCLLKDRAPNEVKYYDSGKRTGRAVFGPNIGKEVPLPYGCEGLDTGDACGSWIASAIDLVRFGVAMDDPKKCPFLKEASIETMLAAPAGAPGHRPNGKPKMTYYACGWDTRPNLRQPGKYTKWHGGLLAGTSSFFLCRDDGIDWAVLFNSDAEKKGGKEYASIIDPLLHKTADEVKEWPEIDLFGKN